MSEITRGHVGRWMILAVTFATIVALAVVISARDASGAGPVQVDEDAGIILVSTGPGNSNVWIRYYEDPTGPLNVNAATASQSITVNNRCKVSSGDNLLKLSSTGGSKGEGLVSNGLGVRTKNNCSTAQGRIGTGQSLTFELGSMFDSTIAVEAIDSVELDVEGKHGADLGYDIYDGNDVQVATLSNSSDNGPDSGTGDNEIKTLTGDDGANFTKITFTAIGSGAEVSIEGGGDGLIGGGLERTALGVNQTLFKLVTSQTFEGELDCNQSVTENGEDGDAAVEVTVTRQNNKGNCDDDLVAYNLVIDNDGVEFDPNIGDREDTNFLVQIDWAPYEDPFTPFNPPPRLISLDGVTYEPVTACESLFDEGANDFPLVPDSDDIFIHPANTPWCMAGESQVLLGNEMWQQVQWYDGGIDPNWR
jgi:hypothetical protein